jgi:hypothetical protein
MWSDSNDLSQYDVLSAADCQRLAEQVLELRPSWTARRGFFTLGSAAYLDAVDAGARHRYLARAPEQNAMLESSFSELYEKIASVLGAILDEDVGYHRGRPLPGFHVFLDAPHGTRPSGAHFDLQWRLAWPNRPPLGTISFTIPIAQPPEGASLDVWHLRHFAAEASAVAIEKYIETRAPSRIEYTPGRMVLHDGHILHAIGRSPHRSVGPRITLQGHGWRTSRGWILYW